MHAEKAAINVCACPGFLLTEGLSTDPGRTCWSQGWSSRSLDHPSDCQSQSGSRRTCPPAEQMWSSVLRSSPRNSRWKTKENIRLRIWQKHETGSIQVLQWKKPLTETLTRLRLCFSTCFHGDHRWPQWAQNSSLLVYCCPPKRRKTDIFFLFLTAVLFAALYFCYPLCCLQIANFPVVGIIKDYLIFKLDAQKHVKPAVQSTNTSVKDFLIP